MSGTIGSVSGSPFELVFQEIPIFVYAHAEHCRDCSRVLDATRTAAPADMPEPTFDVSLSLDGAILATRAFVEVCTDVPGVAFSPVDAATWRVDIDRVVRVDPFDSHVRTGTVCETCGQPRYVVRSGPLHLDPPDSLPLGFSRTDIEFGDTGDFGPTQPVRIRPNVLVDRETGRMLKSSHLLGIHLITQP